MKRKIAVMMMSVMMAAGALAGCGNSSKEAGTGNGQSVSEQAGDAGKGQVSQAERNGSEETEGAAMTGEISVQTREDGSGTRGAFIELMGIEQENANGEKEDMTTVDAGVTNSTEVMLSTVAANPQSIGYVSLGAMNDTVKALQVDGVEATTENVANGTYAVARPFNIATTGELSASAQDFIDYILSAEGQTIVEDNGYIAVEGNAKAYSGTGATEKIVVGGSSSVSPVMEKLKEGYQEIHPDADIEIQTSDSTTGMTNTAEGTLDIGMASRELKDSEIGNGLTSTVIAMDGIAVIVNPENPITGLTSGQIMKIYTGEVTAWDEIGE